MSNLDWANLGFSFLPVNGFVQAEYDKVWSEPKFIKGSQMNISIAANVLHYGQSCFEGLKAFTTKNRKVALFRPHQNFQRLKQSAERLCMIPPTEDLFLEAIELVVTENKNFLPPYGTGASLYIRPILIGTEPMIGIAPSNSYRFMVMVTPVGLYYKNGFRPIKARIVEKYDRAAPKGTGAAKVAGNYAASLISNLETKSQGLDIDLYTDSVEHQYIDEFTTSNFIGITSDKGYHTPDSPSILRSITNLSLQVLAKKNGLTVHKRKISIHELGDFSEVGACGTAAMIMPICSIQNKTQKWSFGSETEVGPELTTLYQELYKLQYGEIEDLFNWLYFLPLEN